MDWLITVIGEDLHRAVHNVCTFHQRRTSWHMTCRIIGDHMDRFHRLLLGSGTWDTSWSRHLELDEDERGLDEDDDDDDDDEGEDVRSRVPHGLWLDLQWNEDVLYSSFVLLSLTHEQPTSYSLCCSTAESKLKQKNRVGFRKLSALPSMSFWAYKMSFMKLLSFSQFFS